MAGRSSRFVDTSVHLQTAPTNFKLADKVKENSDNFLNILEEEKAAHEGYASAWTSAADRYESHYKDELPANYLKKINEVLPKKITGDLSNHPTYIPTAVIVYTESTSEFTDEFNTATRKMLSEDAWDSYPFKSLMILLKLAMTHLPSRPDHKSAKNIFRGLDTENEFTVGQEFSLSYCAPFTTNRNLALGKTTTSDEENDDEDEETVPRVTHQILRMTFIPRVRGFGVRLLSPHPDDEREVLVMPLQTFKVVDIKKKAKKGFKVVIVEPANK